MTSCMDLLEASEQLCYVQCSFCTTILLVSVPCTSLLKMVTVRCGHCTGLLSVNMMRASLVPFHLLAPLKDDSEQIILLIRSLIRLHLGKLLFLFHLQEMQELCGDGSPKACDENYTSATCFEDNEDQTAAAPTVNKPPEKRQRAPSAYNRFMKEEIQRLKTIQPGMTHKEAFTTAAKNWAHFPRIQYKGGESCSQRGGKLAKSADADEVDVQSKSFYEKKT
ncbi:protein YABBY 7-like [Aristolochia californica]|uniref:protein YABBY 7-like n=1 Tax=Aristolochia californica TaxID=171875 RepID=UPI0035D667B6